MPSDPSSHSTLGVRILAGSLLSVYLMAGILVVARFVERKTCSEAAFDIGLCRGRAVLYGALLWVVPATSVFALLTLLGQSLEVQASAGQLWGTVALVGVAVLLSEAIPEELVFRGYVMAVLGERLHGWWVISIQAALFAGLAFVLRGGVDLLDFSLFITMGVVFGYLRQVTGSVWTSIGIHAAFQSGAQLVLTHEVLIFNGSELHAMLALGAVPFTCVIIAVSFVEPAVTRFRSGHRR
ncbi:CPBP family intramembrane glutamic endopeptidase [Glutamicibacter sp. PS]|uniref:CPBP family intramembrane glutamic endopeptidase n=1 Tax=Glutamicibacter sp. PS TaxID=3075634 RepID=UPI002842B418|nr:CPBP family intramembrane glutamic endopeptidase [Glutamicibacter sp. PS]MDR4534495.1 CPBP family intramembrane metalloprotease [Glutamicibacter sp. PS]